MATLKDLASKLAGMFASATPAGMAYQNLQKYVPQGQQAIQSFGQNRPTATNVALKFEPIHNFVQNTVASIPQNPVNLQPVRNWINSQPLFPQAPAPVRTALNLPFQAVGNVGTGLAEGMANALPQIAYNAYRIPQKQTPQQFVGRTAGILEGIGSLSAPNAIKQGIKGAIEQPKFIKNALVESVKAGAKEGAQMGATFGALGGLRTNQDSTWEQIKGTVLGAGQGAVAGAVMGGVGAGIARGGKVFIEKVQGEARTQAKEWTKQLLAAPRNKRPAFVNQFQSADQLEEYLYRVYRNRLAIQKINDAQSRLPQPGMTVKPIRQTTAKQALEQEIGITSASSPTGGKVGGVNARSNTATPQKTPLTPQPPVVRPSQTGANPAQTLAQTIAQTARGGKTKERKFVTTVKESGKTAEPVKQMVEGQYIPKSNDALSQSARRQIKTDINAARDKALNGLDDESVAIANELISHYSAKGDYDSAAYIANTTAERLTEAGRAVQAASLYDKLTPEGIQRYASSELNKVKMQLKPDDAKRLYDIAKQVQSMPAGEQKAMAQQKLMEEVQNLIPTPVAQKLITLWKAGLLTGLKTTGRNIASNAINQTAEIVKDIPATMTDMVASLFTGKRSKTFTVRGVGGGLVEGGKKGIKFLTTGYDERRQMGKLDTKYVNWGSSPLGKAAKAYTQTIFRALGAQDQPFYYSALRRSLNDQAQVAAMNAGKSGDAAFIKNLIDNPTELMIKTSVLDAERAVFQNKTAIGSAINSAKAKFAKMNPMAGASADFVVPFTGVPSSIAGQVVNYTPVGIAKTIIENIGKGKFDQRQFSEGIGRGITGTAILAIGSELMKKGLMTLDSPTSEKERQQWDLEGKKPFSVLVDGKWRSIGSLGPQAQALLIGGYYAKGGAGQALLGGLKSQKEQTFMQGVKNISDAIDNPQGFAKSYAQSAVSSFIPTLSGDIAKGMDPFQRETNTITDSLKAKIPGMKIRGSLLPQRNAFGEAKQNDQGFIGSMLDIFNSSPVKSDIVTSELRRLLDAGLNTTPSKIDKVQSVAGKKVNLTPQLQDVLESSAGPVVKQMWEETIKSKEYQALSDENKAKLLQKMLDDVRGVEKLKTTTQINPEASAKALIDLTKNQRTYLTTGKLPVKLPEEKKQEILTPEQVKMASDILASDDPNKETKLAQLLASVGKGKKPKKISFKKISTKKIKFSMPKQSKIQTIKIASPPKPKTGKSATIKVKAIKTKPIKFAKMKGMKAG